MTTTILQILISPRPQSFSRRVARIVVARLAELCPDACLIERDLAAELLPYPDVDLYDAILSSTPDDDPRFALSERLVAELDAADLVVIGTPVNNFTVPATLKSWIDHIVRIRRTFRSAPDGKIGMLRDRPCIVVSAHGGYVGDGEQGTGSAAAQPDFLRPYLRVIFETIGIRSVEFLTLEGMSRGPDAVARSFDDANRWIEQRLPLIAGRRVRLEGR